MGAGPGKCSRTGKAAFPDGRGRQILLPPFRAIPSPRYLGQNQRRLDRDRGTAGCAGDRMRAQQSGRGPKADRRPLFRLRNRSLQPLGGCPAGQPDGAFPAHQAQPHLWPGLRCRGRRPGPRRRLRARLSRSDCGAAFRRAMFSYLAARRLHRRQPDCYRPVRRRRGRGPGGRGPGQAGRGPRFSEAPAPFIRIPRM